MKKKVTNKNRSLFCGILLLVLLTLLSQAMSVTNMILSSSETLSDSLLTYTVYTLRTLFDSFIYATGAAMLVFFTSRGEKKNMVIAYISSIVILFADYGTSFAIDLFLDHISGYEFLTVIYLLLNIMIRAAMYGLIIIFATAVYKRKGPAEMPAPFLSFSHPVSCMLISSFFVRVLPYVIFEIYSNITGIIEYGFDMTAEDVLSIFSAYVEIFIDGIIVYIMMYLFVSLLDHRKSR